MKYDIELVKYGLVQTLILKRLVLIKEQYIGGVVSIKNFSHLKTSLDVQSVVYQIIECIFHLTFLNNKDWLDEGRLASAF